MAVTRKGWVLDDRAGDMNTSATLMGKFGRCRKYQQRDEVMGLRNIRECACSRGRARFPVDLGVRLTGLVASWWASATTALRIVASSLMPSTEHAEFKGG